MTTQYIGGELVNLATDSPPVQGGPERASRYKGGVFGQPYMPRGYRGLFARPRWALPPEDEYDRSQDPDWTTKGVTYPVVGLVKRHHAQAMADKRQALYLANQGLSGQGLSGPGMGAGVLIMLFAVSAVALASMR